MQRSLNPDRLHRPGKSRTIDHLDDRPGACTARVSLAKIHQPHSLFKYLRIGNDPKRRDIDYQVTRIYFVDRPYLLQSA